MNGNEYGEDLNLNGKWDMGLAVGPSNIYEANANDSDTDNDGIMDGVSPLDP